MSQTNEHAFETYVEEILLTKSGWTRGNIAEWDKELALFPSQVCSFIEATQPKLWAEMRWCRMLLKLSRAFRNSAPSSSPPPSPARSM